MKKLVDFLAPLGVLVLLGSQAWSLAGRALPGQERYYLIGGLFLIVLHLVLRFEALVAFVGRRQLRYGGNALLFVAGVLAILVALNWLAFRNTKRWDLTKNQRYSLSEQTKKVVSNLKEDVTITYFQRTAAMGGGSDRLQDFQSASPRIKTSFVDPLQSPAKAREYEAKGPWPVVVVEKGSARERITSDSEQDITNAIIKVTRDKKKTVCFVEGEGERDIEQSGDQGYTNARAALGRSQYETKKVLLLREKNVPPECTVIAVTGPEKDPLPPVIDALRSFVQGGGKALVLLEPEMKESYPNLAGLLKEWNVEAGKDVVVDVSGMGQLFGTSELTPIVAQYPAHDITRDFRVMTAFHTARSMATGKESKPSVTAQDLLQTSARSWAESDLSLKGEIKMDDGKDRIGPITLGAAVTLRDTTAPSPAPSPSPSPGASPSPAAEEPMEKKEGRVVAIGDADFASNALFGFQGNQDFFLNTVAWLAQDADLISIRPREPEDQRLFLTRNQQRLVSLLALAFLPGAFVALGIAKLVETALAMKGPFVRTLVIVLLAAGLGAYVFLVENKKPADTGEKKKEKVFALAKAKVKQLSLEPKAGEAVTVKKDGDKWRLVAPREAPADSNEVDTLLSALENLESDEIVSESASDLKQFGLDAPSNIVSVVQEGVPQPLKLLLGEKTPDSAGLYAKTADKPRVFTIAAFQESSLNKKPFELRDRDLLKVKRDAVKAVEVGGPGESYALERSDKGEWSFTRPLKTAAGRWSIDGILGTLESLKMESVAAEDASKDLKKYGLDKPQRTLKLTLADGGYKILEIGGSAPGEKKYHAREAQSPLVAVIPGAIVDDLAKGMKELRAKRLADVSSFDVLGIELASEGKTTTLARTTAKDKDGLEQQNWKKTAPDKKDADRAKVEDALFKLTGLEVQEFVDKPQAASAYGLDAPTAKVTLKLTGGKPPVVLELGKKDSTYYSRRPGDDSVLKLDTAKVEEALKVLREL